MNHKPKPRPEFGSPDMKCADCGEPLVEVWLPCGICAEKNEHSPQCPKTKDEDYVFPAWRHYPTPSKTPEYR